MAVDVHYHYHYPNPRPQRAEEISLFPFTIVDTSGHVPASNQRRLAALVYGFVMVALCAVVACYLLITGLHYLAFGYTAVHSVIAGFTLFLGTTFAIAGVLNVGYTTLKIIKGDFTKEKALNQIGTTIFIPIYFLFKFLPYLILSAICSKNWS